MCLERGELIDPQPLGLGQTGYQIGHRFRPQAVDADTGIEVRMRLLDQPARLQRAQVPAERRGVQPQRLRQFPRPPRPLAQQLDHPPAMRIGKRRQGLVEDRPAESGGRPHIQRLHRGRDQGHRVVGWALILDGAIARSSWAQGYPWGTPEMDARAALEEIAARPNDPARLADVARFASPNATEEERAALVNYWRHGASPGARLALMKWVMSIDVRDVLPAVRVPTLILQHGENPQVPRDAARFVADQIPGATYVELHDKGNIPPVAESEPYLREVQSFLERAWDAAADRDTEPDRVLATVLFTDIVASSEHAARLGDRGWRDLLQQHHELVRRELLRYRGVEVDTAGDGFFASFDGPARAIRCAGSITDSVQTLGLAVRAGLHTGECEVVDGKVTGIAVHTGARVASQAQPGEVLVSSTVKDLVAGSGIEFEDRGTAELQGIPGNWRLFAVAKSRVR